MAQNYVKNSPLDLALIYMEIVFSGERLGRLGDLLEEPFRFRGPLFSFSSVTEYVQSLRNDPPVDWDYSIIKAMQSGTSACLIYEFKKPGVVTPMVQLFETRQQKICDILLVFDTAVFKE